MENNMKRIVITEDNYMEILDRMQSITNKYKCYRFYQVFTEDMKEQKEYRHFPLRLRVRRKYYYDGNGYKYKHRLELDNYYNYIEATKHRCKTASEEEPDSYDAKLYKDMKCIIRLDIGPSQALVLNVGDSVRFLPFGLGFITYSDNDYVRMDGNLSIYRETFIPNLISGKIEDLEEESRLREEEWEEDAKSYNEMYEEQLERELGYDDYYYYDDAEDEEERRYLESD